MIDLTDQETFYEVLTHFCICRISITTKGKNAAIAAGTIFRLVSILQDPLSEVRLNALKVNTYVAKVIKTTYRYADAFTYVLYLN